MVETKRCIHCKVVRPVTDYWKQTSSKDGYEATCKPCRKNVSIFYLNPDCTWGSTTILRWRGLVEELPE